VVEEMKNVIAMESIRIIVSDDVDIEELVKLAIGMPDIVLFGDIDMDIEPVELAIDISMAGWCAKNIGICKVFM
jgi:hypothetical protein